MSAMHKIVPPGNVESTRCDWGRDKTYTVSSGLAIQAVVPTLRARKSLAPALRNWSPTCSVFSGPNCSLLLLPLLSDCFSKYFWHTVTPHDLSPMSTKTSRPPLLEKRGLFC